MKAILREFPDQIETPRLLIRSPMPGDGAMVRQAVIESQEELKQWLPWAVNIPSEEEYEVRVREGQLKFLSREDMWLMVLLKETGQIIGGSGLHRINWDVPKFEIGYWLHTAHTGKGYMTEAVTAISNFAFDVLHAERVEIRCDARNERSAAVARRLNFTHEATLHRHGRHHLTNDLIDTYIFAKLRQRS
ncbi:MAG: GNAT family N-acetyltransferase [Ardenticatenaceae bacterium]|nr:GNAT family N-acetyltransferase [Anaerolineales bacterium]MCB8920717.1 GNAT family N-acetyltransferase [Ardenticatenaceae bacterium]MCB8989676.1 GNAT family N-acetyltransferase [Ardenticatenaceae bacterium]MCB9002865.1 GNAT family N-acetyltransferase [Ardenticatenaceae bacterium]